jgi:LEA14-like dessication related protein
MDSKNMGLGERLRRFPLLLVGLLLIASGVLLLAWIVWLVWYDVTVWGKDVVSVLFGSRVGEVMSLGIGFRAFYYLFLGLALVVLGPVTLIIQSANSLSMTIERVEVRYTLPSESSRGSQLTTIFTINILNDGFFPVSFSNVGVKIKINNIDVGSFLQENEYTIPRFSWRQFEANCSLTDDEANALLLTKEWKSLMEISGEASCVRYKVPVSARALVS